MSAAKKTLSLSEDKIDVAKNKSVFKLLSCILIATRLVSAFYNTVTDCDETYNYWEPTHQQLFGHGFQTWEYSPVYSLRSYFYTGIHALPMWIIVVLFSPSKVVLFYSLRSILALFCAVCEMTFCWALFKKVNSELGVLTLFLKIFSTGMFISSSAYLPSSCAMYFIMLAYAFWLHLNFKLAVFMIASASLIGWPFAAVLGITVAVDMMRKKLFVSLVKYSITSAAVILLPMVIVDYYYYQKIIIAPLNLIYYNIFSSKGPELYGIEPFSFYIYNGILNFNIAFPLAFLCLLTLLLSYMVKCISLREVSKIVSLLTPFFLWMVIFFYQSHKEERFLFPVYPFICCASAVSLYTGSLFMNSVLGKRRGAVSFARFLLLFLFIVISVSRTFLLYVGYGAPLNVYSSLNSAELKINKSDHGKLSVCVGKEWHRFPSHFFLPSERWHLKFLRSEFKGQLPKEYAQGPEATSLIPSYMNDENKEEPSRYVVEDDCDFLVDLDVERSSDLEPSYVQKSEWLLLYSYPFLDAATSSKWARSLYLPKYTAAHCSFRPYVLLGHLSRGSKSDIK